MSRLRPRRPAADVRPSFLASLRQALAPDPFGHRRVIGARWSAHAALGVDSAAGAEAAFRLGVAVGYCQLSGTHPEGLRTELPPPTVEAGLRFLRNELHGWTVFALQLQLAQARSGSSERAVELARRWILIRTDVLAILEAVRRTEAALQDRSDPGAVDVAAEFDRVGKPLDEFDAALEAGKPAFAALVDDALVGRLRGMLCDGYRRPLPWWLDPDSFRGLRADEPVICGNGC